MPGYKQTRLGALNRWLTYKNKLHHEKLRQRQPTASTLTSRHKVDQIAKSIQGLLGQARCTSYSDRQIASIYEKVDVLKSQCLTHGGQTQIASDLETQVKYPSLSRSVSVDECVQFVRDTSACFSALPLLKNVPNFEQESHGLVDYESSEDGDSTA